MELKVNEVIIPEKVTFNYEELKRELTEKVSMYETLVYTEENIKDAKSDRANLNKLKKALNDERIRREKEYMQPFNEFKAQINEIIGIIDKPVAVIDKQVKEYEEKQKQDKKEKIIKFYGEKFAEILPDVEMIHPDKIFDSKWLNASASMKSVQEEIISRFEQIKTDLVTLSNLPEFGYEATEVYKSTLDINKAIAEGHRLSEMQKRKAEHEAEQERLKAEAEAKKQEEQLPGQIGFTDTKSFDECINPPVEEVAAAKQWVRFQALMTVEQARELKKFFDDRNIEFKAV